MIEIQTEKECSVNGKARRILSIKCLKFEQLPEEYWNKGKYPYIGSYNSGDVILRDSLGNRREIKSNRYISEKDFQEILNEIEKAGNRLKKINNRIKKECEGWNGKETFMI